VILSVLTESIPRDSEVSLDDAVGVVAELYELVFQLLQAVSLLNIVVESLPAREPIQRLVDGLELFVDGGVLGSLAGCLILAAVIT